MFKSIKAAAAAAALFIGLMAHTGPAQAQRWDGWYGFGWGGAGWSGAGLRSAVLPGVHWAGRWGGRAGPGRPVGWGEPWGWSYYRTDLPASSWGSDWPGYSNAGYGDCYQRRSVWTQWGWRRQWVNVCPGWGGGWGW